MAQELSSEYTAPSATSLQKEIAGMQGILAVVKDQRLKVWLSHCLQAVSLGGMLVEQISNFSADLNPADRDAKLTQILLPARKMRLAMEKIDASDTPEGSADPSALTLAALSPEESLRDFFEGPLFGTVRPTVDVKVGEVSAHLDTLVARLDRLCKGYHMGEALWKAELPNDAAVDQIVKLVSNTLKTLNAADIENARKELAKERAGLGSGAYTLSLGSD